MKKSETKEIVKMKMASLAVIAVLVALAVPKIITGESGLAEMQSNPITGFFVLPGIKLSIDLILFLITISTIVVLFVYEVAKK